MEKIIISVLAKNTTAINMKQFKKKHYEKEFGLKPEEKQEPVPVTVEVELDEKTNEPKLK